MALTKKDIHRAPYDQPTIIGYNRLEGVPGSSDYGKSLSAEVHDALWMLTRQWQMGEFDGEDAGSAVKTTVLSEQQMMGYLDADGKHILPMDAAAPLEMMVEKEGRPADIAFRVEMGKLFKQHLVENNLQGQMPDFLKEFKLQLLENGAADSPEGRLVAGVRSGRSDAQLFDSLKNRVLDGFAVFQALTAAGDVYKTWVDASFAGLGGTVVDSANKAGQDFLLQVQFFYGDVIPSGNGAWRPERLGYQFSVKTDNNTPKATIMTVDEYSGDRLDWYDLDVTQYVEGTGETTTRTFIPSPVTYPGMPRSRWWEMEENEINFGNVNVKTTDIPTLILMDFALIYGNDWMMIPFPMKLNQLCSVKGFLVKDVFGFYTYIPPVDPGSDVSWKKWGLFSQSDGLGKVEHPMFYLAPALLKPLEQEPMERVSFLRDEVSNMMWAFENVIPGAWGKGLRGVEVADKEEKEDVQPVKDQPAKYLLGATTPFYQVPFMPVEVVTDPTHSQMLLQRASMPGAPAPRGVLLTEIPSPYYIREENISRAGTTVVRRWQRARWVNGVVAQWIGREKRPGKSEGGTSLSFDVLT